MLLRRQTQPEATPLAKVPAQYGESPGKHEEWIVDGKRLEILAYPPATGKPTIVMLHEGLGSVSMWRDFPEHLARTTNCGVLVYSRYGHGHSDALREPRTVEFMHDEAEVGLPELLKLAGVHHPILLGHSDGASICILHAAAFPEIPRAVILEAPHVFVEEVTISSIAKIREEYGKSDLRAKLARHHQHPDEMFHGWTDIWLNPKFRKWNIEQCLDEVRCPVLVIQGHEDEYGTAAQVAAIERRVSYQETLMLSNCGHSPHRDQPQTTLEAIARFVGKIVP
jgi:pimeloyl-ACP methyl ester carboxylesterase